MDVFICIVDEDILIKSLIEILLFYFVNDILIAVHNIGQFGVFLGLHFGLTAHFSFLVKNSAIKRTFLLFVKNK
jgi:hypothetical protein